MKSNTMKNVFQHITVSKNEYQVMLQYTASEKLQYLINPKTPKPLLNGNLMPIAFI